MHSTTRNNEIELHNRIAVDIMGLMALLSCGRATALEIADQACAIVKYGKRTLYSVDRIKEFIYKEAA